MTEGIEYICDLERQVCELRKIVRTLTETIEKMRPPRTDELPPLGSRKCKHGLSFDLCTDHKCTPF